MQTAGQAEFDPRSVMFSGPGTTPTLLASTDWEASPLGPVSTWPARLVQVVRLVLASGMPMAIWWGDEYVQIYNEGYARLAGNKHPAAIGRPAEETWAEAWDDIWPLARRVLQYGESTFTEARLLLIERHGYLEETYWTSSYSPIRDDGSDAVLGMLVASTDVTASVVGARRLETVRQLGTLSSSTTVGLEQTCKAAVAVLAANRQAVPFATIHLIQEGGTRARLAAGYGVAPGAPFNPADEFDLSDAPELSQAVASGTRVLAAGLRERVAPGQLDPGPLGNTIPDAGMVLPITVSGMERPLAVATLGVNPYRAVDDVYLAFFQLVARQLRVAISDAVAYNRAEDKAVNLTHALESNRQIGVAIGVLMVRESITQEQAFERLREASQSLNRKLRDIADEVVYTGTLTFAAPKLERHPTGSPQR